MDWNQFDKVRTMDYDLFYLGRMLQDGFDNVADKPIDDMICKPDYSYQTHAYMLSKKGIRKLVEKIIYLCTNQCCSLLTNFYLLYIVRPPRTELNNIFVKDMNTFALNESVVEQSRTEMYNNSLTQPNDL